MFHGQGFLSWMLAPVGIALLALSVMLTSDQQVQAAERGQAQCDGPSACNTTNCLLVGTDCPGPRSRCAPGANCNGCQCRDESGTACACKL